jgi:bifunctional DNA-binding transcriptional regulator/antitoxin component of YhaV-PrlF toxin-antitoxin module
MKRKVNRVGQNTLTVSLPNKWAKKYGIKAGDEIEVAEDGNKVMMSTSMHLPKKEITIVLPKKEDYLQRFICSPYIKGYDVIYVKFDDREVYDSILQTSKLMMGFEIVENTEKSCKIMNVSTKLEQNFDVLLNRLFMEDLMFGKELLERLKTGGNIQGLLEYEFNANRIAMFCQRTIHTGDVGELQSLYFIINNIEIVIDCFRHIVETVGDKKIKLNKEAIDVFERIIKLEEINYTLFSKALKGENLMGSLDLFRQHKKIRKELAHSYEHYKGDSINLYIIGRLFNAMEISHHTNQELFY